MEEVAKRLSTAVGRNVHYVDIAPDEKPQALLAAGIPPAFADAIEELFRERRKEGNVESAVNLSTHEQLGVRPTTFEEFARRNAAIFRDESARSHLWALGWQAPDAAFPAR